MRRTSRLASLLVAILLVTFVPLAGQEGKTPREVNLTNLQTALNREFTSRALYRAFAEKASEEGYKQAASLFHAFARAEEIHAGRFMSLIISRGGNPTAVMDPFEVKSTRENIQATLTWERRETEKLYPSFAEAALAANDKPAAEAFDVVRRTEIEHTGLCTELLSSLEEHKDETKSYWVCKGCGYVSSDQPGGNCPLCKGPASAMVEIN